MAMVSGRVTGPDGGGVAGVYVYAIPASGRRFGRAPGTHSDLTGRWSLELADGQWTVRQTGHGIHEVVVAGTAVDIDGEARKSTNRIDPVADLTRLLARRRRPVPE
jgi:hypothetical protein